MHTVARDEHGGKTEFRAFRELDRPLVSGHGVHGQHRPEDLLRHDLAAGRRFVHEGGTEVETAEPGILLATKDNGCPIRLRAIHDAGDPLEMGAMNLEADIAERIRGSPCTSNSTVRVKAVVDSAAKKRKL